MRPGAAGAAWRGAGGDAAVRSGIGAFRGIFGVGRAVGEEHAVEQVVVGVGPVARVISFGPERVVEHVVVGVGVIDRAAPRNVRREQAKLPRGAGREPCRAPPGEPRARVGRIGAQAGGKASLRRLAAPRPPGCEAPAAAGSGWCRGRRLVLLLLLPRVLPLARAGACAARAARCGSAGPSTATAADDSAGRSAHSAAADCSAARSAARCAGACAARAARCGSAGPSIATAADDPAAQSAHSAAADYSAARSAARCAGSVRSSRRSARLSRLFDCNCCRRGFWTVCCRGETALPALAGAARSRSQILLALLDSLLTPLDSACGARRRRGALDRGRRTRAGAAIRGDGRDGAAIRGAMRGAAPAGRWMEQGAPPARDGPWPVRDAK